MLIISENERNWGRALLHRKNIDYPDCKNIEDLRQIEGEWIRQMATLNAQVAGRTPEQYRQDTVEQKIKYDKIYCEKNKEKKSQQNKVRYENKKEHIKQKSKERYENKKDIISAKNSVKCQCECGMTYTYGNKARHFKSNHHQNYLNNNIDNNVQIQEE